MIQRHVIKEMLNQETQILGAGFDSDCDGIDDDGGENKQLLSILLLVMD